MEPGDYRLFVRLAGYEAGETIRRAQLTMIPIPFPLCAFTGSGSCLSKFPGAVQGCDELVVGNILASRWSF